MKVSSPDLADRLTAAERERASPNVRPKDAATLIVIDRSGAEPRVLMGRRNPAAKFMPDKFVFPGGRIDPGDRHMTPADQLSPAVAARLMQRVKRASATRARALALAAIRETFEETGLLLGSRSAARPSRLPGQSWLAYCEHGVVPELGPLHLIARAITPPRRPRRFDTAFFAIDAGHINGHVDGHVGPSSELVELAWIGLEAAQRLDLPTITSVVLHELGARLGAGMGLDLPVPFYHERNRRWLREEL
jgi:8-oxo-dGTP pyrophosphatase MutT (NUDIX family)